MPAQVRGELDNMHWGRSAIMAKLGPDALCPAPPAKEKP